MHYEDILSEIGSFGKYQKIVVVLLSLVQFPTACQFIVQIFLAANTDHWCVVPNDQAVNCTRITGHHQLEPSVVFATCQEAQKNKSIPYELDSHGNEVFSSCERYDLDPDEDSHETSLNASDIVPCDLGWDFDRSLYKSTINEDFSLVCERQDLASVAQSVWFAGLLMGSLVWGSVGDWIGRKRAMFLSLSLVTVSSISTAFVSTFPAFVALRFFTAACSFGAFAMSFVISAEIVGPKYRVVVGTISAVCFALGYVLLSILAFFMREWRHLELAISSLYVATFLLLLIIPESPRWYISKGRFKEAKEVIEKIARWNGTEVPRNMFERPETQESLLKESSGTTQRVTYLDLVWTPNIRKKTLIIFFSWFMINMTYYGLALSTSALGVDDYAAAFVSGALELPAYLSCLFFMEKFGRRLSLSGLLVFGGVFCFSTGFVPPGVPRVVVAMMGKFPVTAAFSHVYIYTSELYPTVIRGMGLCSSSMAARISGILCPFILLLGKHWSPLPLCIFGAGSVLAGVLALLLPETLGRELPDTIEEGERFGRGQGCQLCPGNEPDDGPEIDKPPIYMPLSTVETAPSKPVEV